MNIIVGTWIEVAGKSVPTKSLSTQCSKDKTHRTYYFDIGQYCPTCGSQIVGVEVESKAAASYVKDIIPDYSGELEIFDFKNIHYSNTIMYVVFDRNGDSSLYAKILASDDSSGAYFLDELMYTGEEIQNTRDDFLRLHSSALIALDNLNIEYELITGVGIFDWQ